MFGRFSFLFLSSFLSHLPALRPGDPGDAAHPLSRLGSPWPAPAAAAMAGLQVRTHRRQLPPWPPGHPPSHDTGSAGHAGGSARHSLCWGCRHTGVGTGLFPTQQRQGWPEGDAALLGASSLARALGEGGVREGVSPL